MTDEDVWKLFTALKKAGVLEPKEGIDEATVAIYRQVFEANGVTYDDLGPAVGKYLTHADNNFWPTPGVFLRVSRLLQTPEQQTEKAWSELWRIVKTVGRYPEAGHEDRALNQAILTCGGIQRFCDQSEEEINYLKAEFRSAYQGALRRAPEDLPETWAGEVNRLNNIAGRQSNDERILIQYHQPVAQLAYDPKSEVLQIENSLHGREGIDRTPAMDPEQAKLTFKALLGAAKLKSDAEKTQREETRKNYEERMQTVLHENAAKRIRKKRKPEQCPPSLGGSMGREGIDA